MRKVIAQPATVILSEPTGDTYVLALRAWLSDEHDQPNTVEIDDVESKRMIDVGDITVDELNLLQATAVGSGYAITVRNTEPGDSTAAIGFPSIPLPVPVIGAIITGENLDTHLEALVEDDGFVATVLLVTDVGLFTRFSGQWIQLRDITVIDGLNSVEIEESALDLYDAADRAGRQLPLASFATDNSQTASPSIGELFVAASASRTFKVDGDEPQSTVGSAVADIPVIEDAAHLAAAIETATEDQRWYLEKRAAALGVEIKFPWQD